MTTTAQTTRTKALAQARSMVDMYRAGDRYIVSVYYPERSAWIQRIATHHAYARYIVAQTVAEIAYGLITGDVETDLGYCDKGRASKRLAMMLAQITPMLPDPSATPDSDKIATGLAVHGPDFLRILDATDNIRHAESAMQDYGSYDAWITATAD